MNRNQFITAALAAKWNRDAHGHLKHTSTDGRLYRLKLQKLAWRLEIQSVLPATSYSPAAKSWTKLVGDYYGKTDQARVDYVCRRVGLHPVVVESTTSPVVAVLRQSLPTGPEPAPPMPAGLFPSWHPAHRKSLE